MDPPHMAMQKQDDQLELTYSNYVRTQDVTLKTCRRWWVIGRSGERESGISVLAAWHNDDDDYKENRSNNKNGWFGCVLWHNNPCGLFNVRSCLYIYTLYILFVNQ